MKIAYCCAGGGAIGWGHVFRGLAVVDRAGQGSALLVGAGFDEVSAHLGRIRPGTLVLPWGTPETPLDPAASGYDVLMIDHYTLDAGWIGEAAADIATWVVDDWMRTAPRATGLINPNVGAVPDDYPGAHVAQWLTGPAYALLRAEVVAAPRGQPLADRVRTLLITMGGSDPDGVTRAVLTVLSDLSDVDRIDVILGPSHAGGSEWPDRTATGAIVQVLHQPDDFLSRCSTADLIICSASTGASELAYLGRPFVPLSYTDNQRRIAAAWAAHDVGADIDTRAAGWQALLLETVRCAVSDAELRRRMAATGMRLVDGRGAVRILNALEERAQ